MCRSAQHHIIAPVLASGRSSFAVVEKVVGACHQFSLPSFAADIAISVSQRPRPVAQCSVLAIPALTSAFRSGQQPAVVSIFIPRRRARSSEMHPRRRLPYLHAAGNDG